MKNSIILSLLLALGVAACNDIESSQNCSNCEGNTPEQPLDPVKPVKIVVTQSVVEKKNNTVMFEWDNGDATKNYTNITYSLCRLDENEFENCDAIASAIDVNSLEASMSYLTWMENRWFIMSSQPDKVISSDTFTISAKTINNLAKNLNKSADDRGSYGREIAVSGDYFIVLSSYGAYLYKHQSDGSIDLLDIIKDPLDSRGSFAYSGAIDGKNILIGEPYSDTYEGRLHAFRIQADDSVAYVGTIEEKTQNGQNAYIGWNTSISGKYGVSSSQNGGKVLFVEIADDGSLTKLKTTNDYGYGEDVDILGNLIAVGVNSVDGELWEAGGVELLEINNGTFTPVAMVTPDYAEKYGAFGYKTKLYNNPNGGWYLLTGSINNGIYIHKINTDYSAELVEYLPRPESHQSFGYTQDISPDLKYLAVGVPFNGPGIIRDGKIELYHLNLEATGTKTKKIQTLEAWDKDTSIMRDDSEFGSFVNFNSSNNLVTSARTKNDFDGSVYVWNTIGLDE